MGSKRKYQQHDQQDQPTSAPAPEDSASNVPQVVVAPPRPDGFERDPVANPNAEDDEPVAFIPISQSASGKTTRNYDLYFPEFDNANNVSKEQQRELKQAALPAWLAKPVPVYLDALDQADPESVWGEEDEEKRERVEVAKKDADGDQVMADASQEGEAEQQHHQAAPSAFGLDPRLVSVCDSLGIRRLFSVQRAVVPRLLPSSSSTDTSPCHDILVSAPTGSGKTLAYVLPIVHQLSSRTVPRLRALIVVPTRDLVRQVYETFRPFADSVGLRVAASAGGSGSSRNGGDLGAATANMATRPEDRAVPGMLAQGSLVHRVLQHHPSATATLAPALAASPGGHSTIDILICTPGRLHDHLAHTPGFTLQHLRYLVIDEADRILNAPESEWLDMALDSMRAPLPTPKGPVHAQSLVIRRPLSSGMPVRGAGCMPGTLGARMRAAAQPIKLLFSATLTRNPEKLARVKLDEPVLLAAAAAAAPALETDSGKPVEPVSKYLVPTTLYETMAIMPSIADKPIALLHLVRHMATGVPTVGVFDPAKRHVQPWTQTTLEPVQQVATDKAWRVLVFTKSVDSARRLAKVLSHATAGEGDAKLADVHLFSRELTQAERTTLLRTFRTSSSTSSSLAQPPVRVLVASDILARGVDLPAVDVVVNYDPPAYVPQYIHRVGRTARAGATGVALTMLAAHEARFFKDMMAEKRGHAWRADKDRVKQVEVRHDVDMVREVEKVYREIAGGDDEFDVDEGNEDEEAQRGAEGQAEMGVDEENEEAVALTELIAIDTQVAAAEESKKSKKSKKEKKEKKDKKDKKSSKSKSKGSVEEDLPKVKEVLAVAPGTNGLGTAPPTSKKKQKTALPAFQGKLMVFESSGEEDEDAMDVD